MTTKQKIQAELYEHINTLNEKDEEGEEVFGTYRDELEYGVDESEETIAELVENADIDSVDFNIGFEQGYMRGLEVALSHCKEIKVYVISVPEDTGSDDLTNEEFMTLAEEQGTVYSLKGFQDAYNYEEVMDFNKYIRII